MPRAGMAAMLLMLGLLCACSHREVAGAVTDEPRDMARGYDIEKIVNVYSWADYIAPDTVSNFEKETGIKVRYDVYDNNEILETKLLSGHSNYDVVVPTDVFFDRQREAGVYRKLDKQALPNLVNTDPQIMRQMALHDPGNLHAIPYMWSTTGIGYNVDMVRKRLGGNTPDSWALLFDPRNAAKLQDCGILIVDSPLDVFGSAIIYLHRDPRRRDPKDVLAAAELLHAIRPFVRNIDPAPIAPLATGDVCLELAWSGDVEAARNRAVEAATGAHIAYLIPREGALTTIDMVAIPADAPHPRNAQIWMNYLLRPEVIAGISNYIKYPNGVAASLPFIDAAVRNDPAVYPDAATRARLVSSVPVPLNYSRLLARAWTRFRTGQ
ncbi:MAG TPA: polyamine ABC transporter substrate-binding protein [Steroidobacteraceae bacterium]